MNEQADKSLYDRSVAAHHEIRDLNQQLLDYLELPRPEPDVPEAHDWAARLCRQLTDLHERVSLTHRVQQHAELLSGLAERYPRASDRVERLQREMEQILADLRALVSAAMSYAEAKNPPNPRLRELTRNVLDALASHESEETRLIQDLISTDVGGSD